MTDKKLTDSEITIKALKEILELMLCEGDLQRTSTISHAIDLINRLQADKEYYKKNRDKYQDDVMFLSKQCDELQAENERLEKAIKVLEIMADQHAYALKKAKAEAYKEFADRCKECFPSIAGAFECFLKEFLEGRESS
jgi:FtsZ-binding cell division protein ZapB